MIWRNPWAWLGLLSIAVPVIIHLLTRRTARVQRFPTLRFLAESRRVPARRIRIHDPLLLAVRVLVLAAAVAALAQPYFVTTGRASRAARTTARAIIVDTSASMNRAAVVGGTALDVARDSARVAANAVAATIETASPARAMAGAAAWLETQPGKREIIVVSDFQAGTLDASDLDALPPGIGLRLLPIAVAPDSAPITITERGGTMETSARVNHTSDAATVTWTTRRADTPAASALRVLASTSAAGSPAAESSKAAASSMAAASTMAAPSSMAAASAANNASAAAVLEAAHAAGAPFHADTTRPVAIMFADVDADAVEPADRPWMGDVLARLAARLPIQRAARGAIDDREHLLLFTSAEPGSLEAAQLVMAVLQALDTSPPAAEYDPAVISAQTVAGWARPAEADATTSAIDASDGRWFWLVALVLLGAETWLRRRRAHAHAG